MIKNRLISNIGAAALMLSLSSSVLAQDLFTKTGTDVTWKYIMDNKLIPVGTSSTKGITGSKIDVNQNHPLISNSPYANSKIVSGVSIHTLGNATVNRPDFPKWSRWYQEDGNTQVFRIFKGEVNVGNEVYYKPRIEAELQTHSSGLKINNGADWCEWSGTYTVVEPVQSNIFQIWSNDDYVLMFDMDNNGKVSLNPRDQSGFRTMVENAKGKSFDIRVRDYGNKYEVYLNGKFFYGRSYTAAYPNRAGHFRWGIYASMKKGTTGGVPKDGMMFVTGAQRRFSNDPTDPIVINPPTDATITSVNAPKTTFLQGEKVNVDVKYTTTVKQDLVLMFQLGKVPWTLYREVRKTVNAGSTSTTFTVDIPVTTPVLSKAYQMQVFLAPTGGSWDAKVADFAIKDLSIQSAITSLNDDAENELLSIFPNPSSDGVFNLSNEQTFRVLNLHGEIILAGKGTKVDISSKPSGTYILHVGDQQQKILIY